MKRDLAEYSSDLDWSSSSPEAGDTYLLLADKRARSEEFNVPGCPGSTLILSDKAVSSAFTGARTEILTRVITPQGQDHLLNPSQLHPSKLSRDPTFFFLSTFHFDLTSPASGRKHFEQWAASLGNDLARHVKTAQVHRGRPSWCATRDPTRRRSLGAEGSFDLQ